MSEQAEDLRLEVANLCQMYFDLSAELTERIDELTRRLRQIARENDVARRLMIMPGIGPVTAVSIAVLAAPPEMFSKGRDFAAWIGLAPRQHSTGGKTRLGKISKMGQRDLRRLLIIGAMSAIQAAQKRGGAPEGSWLARMLARKPKMLVAVALANIPLAHAAHVLPVSGWRGWHGRSWLMAASTRHLATPERVGRLGCSGSERRSWQSVEEIRNGKTSNASSSLYYGLSFWTGSSNPP